MHYFLAENAASVLQIEWILALITYRADIEKCTGGTGKKIALRAEKII